MRELLAAAPFISLLVAFVICTIGVFHRNGRDWMATVALIAMGISFLLFVSQAVFHE